jgi:putative Mg2+ transporter-C (MgtC) family protein
VTGAIGTAVGLGSIDVAVMLSLVTLVTLHLLSPLKRTALAAPAADKDPDVID